MSVKLEVDIENLSCRFQNQYIVFNRLAFGIAKLFTTLGDFLIQFSDFMTNEICGFFMLFKRNNFERASSIRWFFEKSSLYAIVDMLRNCCDRAKAQGTLNFSIWWRMIIFRRIVIDVRKSLLLVSNAEPGWMTRDRFLDPSWRFRQEMLWCLFCVPKSRK